MKQECTIIFYGSLTSVHKEGSIYQITHMFIRSFNCERIFKTSERTFDLCGNEEVTRNVPEDVLIPFRVTASETEVIALHQE